MFQISFTEAGLSFQLPEYLPMNGLIFHAVPYAQQLNHNAVIDGWNKLRS